MHVHQACRAWNNFSMLVYASVIRQIQSPNTVDQRLKEKQFRVRVQRARNLHRLQLKHHMQTGFLPRNDTPQRHRRDARGLLRLRTRTYYAPVGTVRSVRYTGRSTGLLHPRPSILILRLTNYSTTISSYAPSSTGSRRGRS